MWGILPSYMSGETSLASPTLPALKQPAFVESCRLLEEGGMQDAEAQMRLLDFDARGPEKSWLIHKDCFGCRKVWKESFSVGRIIFGSGRLATSTKVDVANITSWYHCLSRATCPGAEIKAGQQGSLAAFIPLCWAFSGRGGVLGLQYLVKVSGVVGPDARRDEVFRGSVKWPRKRRLQNGT